MYKLALIDGFGRDIGQGAVVALVSVALVFAILAIIIAITSAVGSLMRKKATGKLSPAQDTQPSSVPEWEGLDTEDEDMVAAVLTAAIDCRNETHKNVRVVSVKEIRR